MEWRSCFLCTSLLLHPRSLSQLDSIVLFPVSGVWYLDLSDNLTKTALANHFALLKWRITNSVLKCYFRYREKWKNFRRAVDMCTVSSSEMLFIGVSEIFFTSFFILCVAFSLYWCCCLFLVIQWCNHSLNHFHQNEVGWKIKWVMTSRWKWELTWQPLEGLLESIPVWFYFSHLWNLW